MYLEQLIDRRCGRASYLLAAPGGQAAILDPLPDLVRSGRRANRSGSQPSPGSAASWSGTGCWPERREMRGALEVRC